MRALDKAIILGTAILAVSACQSSSTAPLVPSGSVTFTNPAGGETYQIGDTVQLAWSCPDCANVPSGDYLQVLAFDGVGTYLLDDTGQMTDSISWVVGSSLQNVELLPGTYQIVAQDAAGYYTAQSRFFDVAAATQ
jgi:hypothetical protein